MLLIALYTVRRTVSQALAQRARVVLGCGSELLLREVARHERTSIQTVC
jgi:hypothetical protein